jgi:hypothetical protein
MSGIRRMPPITVDRIEGKRRIRSAPRRKERPVMRFTAAAQEQEARLYRRPAVFGRAIAGRASG